MVKTSFSESTAKLNEAIRKLEAFSDQQSKERTSSSTSKTLAFVRTLLKTFDTSKKKDNSEDDVRSAIELINCRRLLIEKLKNDDDPAKQNLVDALYKAVYNYNKTRLEISQQRIWPKFLSKDKQNTQHDLPKIDLPEKTTVAYYYSENPMNEEEFKQPISSFSVNLSKQSAELFQMKVLTLLERYGIASNPEARGLVKKSPILSALEEDNTKCTLTQTLPLFPGLTVVVTVKGTSTLDSQTQTINNLFPKKFFVSLESKQTGYPDAFQSSGWELGPELLPSSPQRLDLLEGISELFERKKYITQRLLPHGNLVSQAKMLLQLKKRVFHQNSQILLEMHKDLAKSILEASAFQYPTSNTTTSIERYFETILNHPKPFEYLSETYQELRNIFISKPHKTLLDAILKGKSTDFGSLHAELRYRASKNILEKAQIDAKNEIYQKIEQATSIEKVKWSYIAEMGIVFGSATTPIILQYLSEDLIFPPPKLNHFQMKIQTAAYEHIKNFLNELDDPLEADLHLREEKIYRLFKSQLTADIGIFQGLNSLKISKDLADYFEKRHESLSNLETHLTHQDGLWLI